MKKELPKEWKFQYHGQAKKVIFDGVKVHRIEGDEELNPTINEFELLDFFERRDSIGILASVDTEIMQMAVNLVDETKLRSDRGRKIYNFWKYLDLTKIDSQVYPDLKYKINSLHLSSTGAQEMESYKSVGKVKTYIYNQPSLDLLFFDGTYKISLSLEDRIKIQKDILNALDSDSGLTQADAFPLFDYSKLIQRTWKIKKGELEYIVGLEKGTVWTGYYGYWEGYCGGTTTAESVWKNRFRFKPEVHFKEAYDTIYKELEAAILDSRVV